MIPSFKTYLKESVWGDIRKKSLGREYRIESSVNNMSEEELCEYLKERYEIRRESNNYIMNPAVLASAVSVPIGYMKREDVHKDYWKIPSSRKMWSDTANTLIIYIYYDVEEHTITMAKVCKSMLTMQKSTAAIFDELDKRFNITEDEHCVWFSPLDGKPVTASFFIQVLDALTETLQYPLIQLIYKK